MDDSLQAIIEDIESMLADEETDWMSLRPDQELSWVLGRLKRVV